MIRIVEKGRETNKMDELVKIMKNAQKERHNNLSNGRKLNRLNDMLMALEFGFKEHEKGNNLECTKNKFIKWLGDKND